MKNCISSTEMYHENGPFKQPAKYWKCTSPIDWEGSHVITLPELLEFMGISTPRIFMYTRSRFIYFPIGDYSVYSTYMCIHIYSG